MIKWYLVTKYAPNGRISTKIMALKNKELLEIIEKDTPLSVCKLTLKQAKAYDKGLHSGGRTSD